MGQMCAKFFRWEEKEIRLTSMNVVPIWSTSVGTFFVDHFEHVELALRFLISCVNHCEVAVHWGTPDNRVPHLNYGTVERVTSWASQLERGLVNLSETYKLILTAAKNVQKFIYKLLAGTNITNSLKKWLSDIWTSLMVAKQLWLWSC